MLYALNRGEGLLLVTGLPGTGKTSLVRDCSRQYTDRRVRFIELSSGKLGSNDVIYLIAYKLGLIDAIQTPVERLAALESGLRLIADQGSRVIIVIDEAQSLADEALDDIKNLSNMEFKHEPLLQFFLVGQKSLKERLQQPGLSQVMQRITAACELHPMSYEDMVDYIRYCLEQCDWTGNPEIQKPALQEIFANSGGIPRRINLLVSRLLLRGMVENLTVLEKSDMEVVLSDLHTEGLLHLPKTAKPDG